MVKLLLVPLAVVAFVVFLLVLGAVGMAVSMTVIGVIGRVWRFVSGADRRARRDAERKQG